MQLPLLKNTNISGKTVFLRADLDVPLENKISNIKDQKLIEDDTRLIAALPTIGYLLKNGAKVIIAGHLGRPQPNNESGITNQELSLKPVAEWFSKRLNIKYQKSKNDSFEGWKIGDKLFLLENLRFYEGEEKNDEEFAKKLAHLADLHVNDAFAMSHRNHASIVGITHFLPHFAGFHLEKEVENLSRAMDDPKRPLVVIIGGKKIETKLPLVEKMHRIADYVLVGGKIAEESQTFLKVRHEKIFGRKSALFVADLTPDGLSITEKSLYNFLDIISLAKTIIWNGAMGFIDEREDQFQATRKIAKAIIKSKAYSVVGGGDTVEFLNRIQLLDKFSFASTGGGAMLAFLSGEKLPGLEALTV